MIAEIGVGVFLAVAGFAVLVPLRDDIEPWPRLWLALPTGAGVYSLVALVGLSLFGSLNPAHALLTAAAIGVLTALVGPRKGGGVSLLGWAAATIGLTLVVVVVSRTYHLTRLTPDSLRYLLFSADIRAPDALGVIHRADLLKRQMGLPSLHALSSLTDRRYLASIGPLFGVSGLGYFVWLTWRATRNVVTHRRVAMVTTAALFLWASNRLVYDAFYINTHIEVAVYLLIAVTGCWLAVTLGQWAWAVPAGIALGVTLLFRPEAPIVAGIVLVAVGASRADWPVRMMMAGPAVLVMALWYGVILWNHANGGDRISLTAPVFGSLVVVLGSVSIVLLGGFSRGFKLVRHTDRLMIAALLGLFIVRSVSHPDILLGTAESTFWNLTYNGLWLLTWPAALVLAVIALMVHRIPHGRLWTIPIVGFGILYWLLPLLRGAAWRIGPGDSGNRILAHFLALVVAFLLLAAVDSWPTDIDEPEPALTG